MPRFATVDLVRHHTMWFVLRAATVLLAAPLTAQSPSALELDVLRETNLARTSPRAYAQYLEPMLDWFDGRTLRRPGSDVGLRTEEGVAAVREAIRFLREQEPVAALEWSDGLWRAARDHARDQSTTGATGHEGADGSTMEQRMNRYGQWQSAAAENIDYGSAEARDVVISLIVDDGVPNRGHRTNIFNPRLGVAGVACAPHERYRQVCVIDYAGGYEEPE